VKKCLNIRASTTATFAPQPLPDILYSPFCLSFQQSLGYINTGPEACKLIEEVFLVNANGV